MILIMPSCYLSRFGYIDHSAIKSPIGGLISKWSVKDALMEFQAFAGLNQTGILDERTLEMMNTPRCGVVDKVGYGSSVHRTKRDASQVTNKWSKLDLTYKIRNYPELLTKKEVDREIDRAFEVWSNVTDLTFTAVRTGQVDIEIRFELGEHGDEAPFDGPGGVIAHAFLPFCGGDAHFDNSETWTIDR
ncbi:Collagenase 3 [Armadillidium vulgare]|nr:Collagenase 3 [Armadillidium vulgare]